MDKKITGGNIPIIFGIHDEGRIKLSPCHQRKTISNGISVLNS